MMLYTSRYANRNLTTSGAAIVAISRGMPKFQVSYQIAGPIWDIAPARELFGKNYEDFREAYLQQLSRTGIERIWNKLSTYRRYEKVVLCCFEDVRNPDDWCHRRMFAEWWERQTGEKIEEYPDFSTPKGQKPAPPPHEN